MKNIVFSLLQMYLHAYKSYAKWRDNGHDAARQSNITNKEDDKSKDKNIASYLPVREKIGPLFLLVFAVARIVRRSEVILQTTIGP